MSHPQIRVGMSGWTFAPWRGPFYPKGLTHKQELEYASRQVSSIEINGTFYSLQKPETFQNWYRQTPEDFVFSIKAPQFITHVLRLKDCREPLCTFLASGLLCLKRKLGPILWQFPPFLPLKDNRFEKFAKLLPHHTLRAAKLAKDHSPRIDGRAWTESEEKIQMRHAFEFRHPSFQNPEFIEMMKEYGIAVVFADSAKKAPYFEDLTSDFVYMRMQGEGARFKRGYPTPLLKRISEKVKIWKSGKQPKDAQCVSNGKPYPGKKDIFIYFNNDDKIHSPLDAVKFLKLVD